MLFSKVAKTSLCLITFSGAATAVLTYSDLSSYKFTDLANKIRDDYTGLARGSRAVYTISANIVDYKYSLLGLPAGSDEYRHVISEVHSRSAKRILKLCEANRGFYVKAGQFVAALRQVPKEYTSTLSLLQDQTVPHQFAEIKEIIAGSLGREYMDLFISFDEQPIAAASIAQVHHAVLISCEEVAVKVQYPGVEQLMKSDIRTMSILTNAAAWIFPEYRFGWILIAFKEALSSELDFIQEARNSQRTANYFRSNKRVKVPQVFWDLTTSKVLTMQFCAGHRVTLLVQVDDLKFLKKTGIDPIEVAKTLVEVFGSMIFIHGFVHGDPHPGNILVSAEGDEGFTLVLLDHGIYKELGEEIRLDYCQLWKALILQDPEKVQQIGKRFGVENYSRFLPLIFTGKMINSKSGLVGALSIEERKIVKQELKSLKVEDISSFMETLPPDFLTVLRVDGLLRSLLVKLGASRHIRLLGYARYAVHGLSQRVELESVSILKSPFYRMKTSFNYVQLTCLVGLLRLLSWIEDVKHAFVKLKLFLGSARRKTFPIINP